jgi:tetratricopeptide (TPR) repeat protein
LVVSATLPFDFAVRLVDGRGFLGLRESARLGPLGIERLELEIPELHFPFDGSGGPERFQHRRTTLSSAELRLDEAHLQAWIDGRTLLSRFGILDLRARLRDGIELCGRVRVGERETALTARLLVAPLGDGQRLRAFLTDVHVYGFLPAPAPLVGLGLLLGLGATPDPHAGLPPGPAALQVHGRPAIAMSGVDVLELHPLELLLWGVMPPSGWRLPAYRAAALSDVRGSGAQLVLAYGGPAAVPDPSAGVRFRRHEQLRDLDRLLLRGDLSGALAGYSALSDASAEVPEVSERRLSILASMPTRFDEAAQLAARLAARHPNRLHALLTGAAVESERGDALAAATRYARAVEVAERAGDPASALESALRAGEEYTRAGERTATRWLERVLSERPTDPRAAALLATRYTAEERWRDLLTLERKRLEHAKDPRQEAQAHARLGRLYLERLEDAKRARDELERAVRLIEDDPEMLRLYARALDATAEPARAQKALARAAALAPDVADAVEALLAAADMAERSGAPADALDHVREALARIPSHPVALARVAALLLKLDRLDEAVSAYERAVAAAPDDAARAPLYADLARLCRDVLKDPHGARTYVERSLEFGITPGALRLAAELAEADDRKEDLAEILGELAQTGDKDAPLRRARVLIELGHFAEAADEASALSPRPEALRLLGQAYEALGQSELLRESLERLCSVSPDASPRIRLARLRADDGDLDVARRLLSEALGDTGGLDDGLLREALETQCDVLLRQGDDAALDVALGQLAAARPATDAQGRARALAAQGAARARLSLHAEAAESYREALKLQPEDAQALAGLGEAAYAIHRWDEARAALEHLHARGLPPRVERALRLGEICERQSQPAAAIGFYQAALEAGASGADGTRAWSALAALHRGRGDIESEMRALLDAAEDERTGESDAVRAGRLVAAADLARKRAGRPEEALKLYERALALDAFHLAALDALESMAESSGEWAQQEQVLARKVAATTRRPAQQKAILGRLAALQADKLGRPDAAREAWRRGLELDPDFAAALSWLADDARTRGDVAEERRHLERLVVLPGDPSEPDGRSELLVRLGQLLFDSGHTIDALAAVKKVLEVTPHHVAALHLYALALEQAGRPAEAVAAWDALAALKPADESVLSRLIVQSRNAGDWERLVGALSRLAERSADAEPLWIEAAAVAQDKLGRPERAASLLDRALLGAPRSRALLGARLALARTSDAGAVEELLGRIAEVETEPGQRSLHVAERARLMAARGQVDAALELLAELDLETSHDAALKLRVELEDDRGTAARAAPVLETLRARAHAAGAEDPERWAVRRLCRLLYGGGPAPAHEALFRRALELDPDDRNAAEALAAIERARGDDVALLASLDWLLQAARRGIEGPAREAELCVEMAAVLQRGGRRDEAEARLDEALAVAPDHPAALRQRAELFAARGEPAQAATLLERLSAAGGLDAAGLIRLGELHEQTGDAARSAAAWLRAGEAVPADRRATALERAGRDAEALALWRTVAGSAAAKRVAALERKRAAEAFEAGRHAEARVAAVEALVGDARDEQAFAWATHGLSPAAVLALVDELSQRLGEVDAAYLFRRAAADLVDDDARRALQRAATLSPDAATLVALGEHESGVEAMRRFQQALKLDPGSAAAALGLARVAPPAEGARALAEIYDQVADARTRVQLSAALGALLRDRLNDVAGAREAYRRAAAESTPADGELRKDLMRSLASLERAGGALDAAEEALETLRSEGAAGPSDLRHLAEILVERGAHDRALEILSALGEKSELLFRCLELAGRHGELLALLEEEAPRRMPEQARALYMRAAAIAEASGDPTRAAELLEKAVPLGPSDAELWLRLGRLYRGPLEQPDRGVRCMARAYAADNSRTDVLLPLADYHHGLSEWAPATDYYVEALRRNAVPSDDLAEVHLRLALHARKRADAIEEEEALLAAVTFGAPDRAWPRLTQLYRERGDQARLAGALKQHAAQLTGPARIALLREAAPLVPAGESAELDEELLAEDPSDDEARDRILQRLRQAGDVPVLVGRLEREIPRASPARQAALALELGRLALRLHDEPRALMAFKTTLQVAPSAEAARGLMETLAVARRECDGAQPLEAAVFDARLPADDLAEVARLCARAHLAPGSVPGRAIAFFDRARAAGLSVQMDPAAFRSLLRAELRFPELVANLDAAASESWDKEQRLKLELEAAETLDRDLGQRDEAARRYAALLDRHPQRRDLAERARQLFAAAAEPIHALAALEKELRLAPPEDLAQLKIVRGELLLAAGADAEAEAEFLHALITTPRVGRAHAALADVYKRRGDLAGALEHLIAAADAPDLEPARAAACAVDAADVLLKEGDTGTAERLYQLAAALDPADRGAVEGLARLAAARGEHERHADLLGRAVLLTGDRRERARLALMRARLFQIELKRDVEAYRCFKEAVACDPLLVEAARGLREMAEARGEWPLAAEQRLRELDATTDVNERARLHAELGRLYEEKLLDSDESLRHYERSAELLTQQGSARQAPWTDLIRLYVSAGKLPQAALALDRLADTLTAQGDDAERAEVLARAGELYERAGDAEAARTRLARAAAIGGEAGRKADESLLRLADQAGDPIELRRRIEERLAVEGEGPERLRLLRRLLELAAHTGDQAEVDMRAQEVLARAADDPVAFVERKRVLEARGDEAGVASLLRARAQAIKERGERAERHFEAGRIAERLGDVSAAAQDYEAALAADPDHMAALDALADLAYRSRQLAKARTLYTQLGGLPSALQPDEVLRRRAELAEDLGHVEEARDFYEAASSQNPSNLQAHEAVARLALARGDDTAAFGALRAILDLLPLDAVDRITDLRRQLGRLAMKLEQPDQARAYFELVLAQDPARAEVLEQLVVLYIDGQLWEQAADAYGRLSYLADGPAQRAELLFRKGEILRLGLDDPERANDAYLKAADLHPQHAPTLRRLISYYYREGDHAALTEVARDLEALPAALDEAAVEAGLGMALGGDEARGTVLVAVSAPTPARLAETMAAARVPELPRLDPGLRAAMRALGGGDTGRTLLAHALGNLIRERPRDLGARLALGRLYDISGDVVRARLQYGVLTFVDPLAPAGTRLRELGAPTPLMIPPEQLVHPSALGPLRDALGAIGPMVRGLQAAPLDADPDPSWTDRLRATGQALGIPELEAAVVLELPDPAWAEPTRPPRLLLARRALVDDAVARFAAARALHLLQSGVSLCAGRSPDDVAALLRAAAALFLPDLAPTLEKTGAFVHAWQAELSALGVKPETLADDQRSHVEMALTSCVLDSAALASGDAYVAAERLTADRVALAVTGDLRAALVALCPPSAATAVARGAAIAEVPELVELLAFAATITP